MLAAILTPSGVSGGLYPTQIVVQPIAGAAFVAGDLVKFDVLASSTYSDAAKLTEYNNKKCPFNVVVAGSATVVDNSEFGIYGVIMEPVAAGARAKVCIGGICNAKIAVATAVGVVLSVSTTAANKSLVVSAQGGWPSIAVNLVETLSANVVSPVLLSGFQIGSNGA